MTNPKAKSIKVEWDDGAVQEFTRTRDGDWVLRVHQGDMAPLRITGYVREEMDRVLNRVLEGTP